MNEEIKQAMEDEDVMVTLELDDGTQLPCEILSIFDIDDQSYIVIEPQEQALDPETDEYDIFVYRYFEEGDNYRLENIDNDEEYERVADRLDEMMDEAYFDEM